MQKCKNIIKRFVADESGQSTTEYILILFLAFMIFSKIKGPIIKVVEGLTTGVEDKARDAFQ